MRNQKMSPFTGIIILFALSIMLSCSNNNDSGTTRLQVALIDAPGDYEAVNIDIQDVQINYSAGDDAWESLVGVSTGMVNILDLTNGVEAALADAEVPSGRLNQIRLVLGNANTLVIDGQTYDLTTPSAQQSGLKLNVNADLAEGVDYKLILDFDAARSIVSAGNSGQFNLKPVIRVVAEAQNGSIKGELDPSTINAAVIAVQNEDSISTYTDDLGKFLLRGVEPGIYAVSVIPDADSGYVNKEMIDVVVVIGELNDLGVITLEQ